MNDPIADMLTRIRNAYLSKKAQVLVPFSKIKYEIAKILAAEKYLEKVEIIGDEKVKEINVTLRYVDKKPAITSIKKVSKSGLRVYVGKEKLPIVLNFLGTAILSTSKGILTNKQAKKVGIGGEVLCEVY